MNDKVLITNSKLSKFNNWLGLNLSGVTWQGRYSEQFQLFWRLLFQDGLEYQVLFRRLELMINFLTPGPLRTWIRWLRENLIIFLYCHNGVSIKELSLLSTLDNGTISTLLRNYFSENYPQFVEEFSDYFQVSSIFDKKSELTVSTLQKKLGIASPEKLMIDDPLLNLEITLYSEFSPMVELLQEEIAVPENVSGMISHQLFVKIKYVIEFVLLLILAVFFFFIFRWINQYSELKITNAIKSFEPKYFRVETTLKFREKNDDTKISNDEISPDLENVEDVYSQIADEEIVAEGRFGTESDVELTSWDSLPKDFSTADQETSQYEEIDKGGFRDSSHGNKKVYRVMMKSPNTIETREKVNSLITKYNVEKGDKVLPGTYVPGGVYYNLFVPREFLKEFIAQVMIESESILYESKSSSVNPAGKTKVFVWIKSI